VQLAAIVNGIEAMHCITARITGISAAMLHNVHRKVRLLT
jgi:hypothetical protein